MRSARSPAGMLIAALLVPVAWFLALAVLYALATLVCAGIVSSPRSMAWARCDGRGRDRRPDCMGHCLGRADGGAPLYGR